MKRSDLEKIYSGKSRTKAVFLFCRECCGYGRHREKAKVGPTYTEASHEVRRCDNISCPLYPYRFPKKTPVEIDWL